MQVSLDIKSQYEIQSIGVNVIPDGVDPFKIMEEFIELMSPYVSEATTSKFTVDSEFRSYLDLYYIRNRNVIPLDSFKGIPVEVHE